MVVMRALPVEQRSEVWASLNPEQKRVYADSIAYRVSDRVLDQVFQGAAQWRLFAVNIDYDWDLRKAGKKCSRPLRCVCNRRVRYQFELESVADPRKHVSLGSTHFAEHLGIPLEVAQEVLHNVNQIQSLMDEVLIKFRAGERFPARFKARIDDGVLLLEEKPFRERILAYKRVDLPLTEVAKERLRRLIAKTSTQAIRKARETQLEAERIKQEELRESKRAEKIAAEELRRQKIKAREAEYERQRAIQAREQLEVARLARQRHLENEAKRNQIWRGILAKRKAKRAGKSPEELAEIKRQHQAEVEAKAEKKEQRRLEVIAQEREAAEKASEQERLLKEFRAAKKKEKMAARDTRPKTSKKVSDSNKAKVATQKLKNRNLPRP